MAVLNLPRLESPRFVAMNPTTGRPVSLGTVTFYAAGTSTLRTIYTERTGEIEAENPHQLDAAGSCEVYLSGPYRIVVRDAAGRIIYDADRINSIPFEAPEGNPGSLLAANNLSDLVDAAAARDAIGLPRQTSTTDAAAGRVMLIGAFGLGGNVPEVSTDGALNLTTRPTGWVRVAAGNVLTVGGPHDAGNGICETLRYSNDYIAQTYYPINTSAPQPYHRAYALGEWGDWTRDADNNGEEALGSWERRASGWQIIRHVTGAAPGVTFNYDTTDTLAFNWSLPVSFLTRPHVTVCWPTMPYFVGCTPRQVGAVQLDGSSGAVKVIIRRQEGAANFSVGAQVNNVSLVAEGRWR